MKLARRAELASSCKRGFRLSGLRQFPKLEASPAAQPAIVILIVIQSIIAGAGVQVSNIPVRCDMTNCGLTCCESAISNPLRNVLCPNIRRKSTGLQSKSLMNL